MKKNETVVISVGGSLIVPDQIDVGFLKKLNAFVRKEIGLGRRFIIITGGGKTARRYINAAKIVSKLKSPDTDWLGIHATRLNGHLLRAIFRDIAHPKVVKNPSHLRNIKTSVIVGAGWKPGCSTDYDAVLMAREVGAKKLINLSDIDYVYDKDPDKYKNAKPIKEIGWTSFRKLLPKKWDPGLSTPFDPVAARGAQKLGMEVCILNGKKLRELERYLDGKTFIGTRVF